MATPTVVKDILMTIRPRFTFHLSLAPFALAMLAVLTMLAPAPGLAQTFNVLYEFNRGAGGGQPYAGLTMNAAGDFYGTTEYGGTGSNGGYGVVFRLSRRDRAGLRRRCMPSRVEAMASIPWPGW